MPERDVNVTFRPLPDPILPHRTAVYYLRNSLYVIHLASLLTLIPRTQNPPTFGSWGFDSPAGTKLHSSLKTKAISK